MNKQLHAESMRILYARSFILEFHDLITLTQDARGYTSSTGRACPQHWRWGRSHPGDRDDFFPGLDFGRIRELHIKVRPCGEPGNWTCLLGSVQSLCKALSPRIAVQGLKRLAITVGEDEVKKDRYAFHGAWVGPEFTQPKDAMMLLETAWLYLRDVGSCEFVRPFELVQSDDEDAEHVQGMLNGICSPWVEGDWVTCKRIPLWWEQYQGHSRSRWSKVPIPLSELTNEDIKTGSLFRKSGAWDDMFITTLDSVPAAELTLQDYNEAKFLPYWDLAERMGAHLGVLYHLSLCGRSYYLWEDDEEAWYLDEQMWRRSYGETEDDFYRIRDIIGEFGPKENEWYIDQRRSLESVLEATDWEAFYALPDSR